MDKQKRTTYYYLLVCCYQHVFSDKKAENQVPARSPHRPKTVDEYQKANDGLLPIKERDDSYSIYLQHPVDFNKLKPKFISQLPGNSFENGGIYQYVIMDVDKDPTVYLIDLRTSEVLKDIRIRIDASGEPLQLVIKQTKCL